MSGPVRSLAGGGLSEVRRLKLLHGGKSKKRHRAEDLRRTSGQILRQSRTHRDERQNCRFGAEEEINHVAVCCNESQLGPAGNRTTTRAERLLLLTEHVPSSRAAPHKCPLLSLKDEFPPGGGVREGGGGGREGGSALHSLNYSTHKLPPPSPFFSSPSTSPPLSFTRSALFLPHFFYCLVSPPSSPLLPPHSLSVSVKARALIRSRSINMFIHRLLHGVMMKTLIRV